MVPSGSQANLGPEIATYWWFGLGNIWHHVNACCGDRYGLAPRRSRSIGRRSQSPPSVPYFHDLRVSNTENRSRAVNNISQTWKTVSGVYLGNHATGCANVCVGPAGGSAGRTGG